MTSLDRTVLVVYLIVIVSFGLWVGRGTQKIDILGHLPRGFVGLVIAVIFAAAMSTLSGEFNSLATATMIDFSRRFVRTDAGDAHYLLEAA